jgi:CPA2 family monovalent cation:H+ antiporter-2
VESANLILTLGVGLAAALVLGYVTQRIGLSPIVGYLMAGIALGPATPGFDADREIASQLADVGVVLLMFGVGLQFHFRELLAVRRIALPGALAHTIIISALGALVFDWAGGDFSAGLVYGFALSMASTVVITRTLSDHDHLHTSVGHISLGWEVLKDLFTVVALVLIPIFFGTGGESGGGGLDILWAILKIIGLIVFTVLVGSRLIPWLLTKVAAVHSRELFTLTILVVALGIAIGSARVFGVSMALGALLAGLVVGRSDFSFRAASEALPMRDAFAVLFFVSVGMLFDPHSLVKSPGLLLLSLLLVLIGKPIISLVVCVLGGCASKVSLGVAAVLAEIGEFSFILATLGTRLGFFGEDATNAIVGTAIVSIAINAVIYKTVAPVDRWLFKCKLAWRLLNARVATDAAHGGEEAQDIFDPAHRAVIIGYGPVGRTVARLLVEQGIEPTIIEMNLTTVRQLKEAGMRTIFGDATQASILEQAGIRSAGTLVLSVSGFKSAGEVIKMARDMNPHVHVLARAAYLADVQPLRAAGADRVFSGEGEVALSMTEYVLFHLGATPEQIDRERERVHSELF